MRMLGPGDVTPDFCPGDLYAPWASHTVMADPIPAMTAIAPARSGLEALALLADTMPPAAGDLLGVLLASAFPVGDGGCEVLRPLWAEEAMHRAFGFMRLVHARSDRRDWAGEQAGGAGVDFGIACDLALQFRELEVGGEREVVPCSAVLRDVVTGLAALFGGPGDITVKPKIEDVSLPVYKRRALVLAAAELVGNALLHAFVGRTSGRIEVGLTANGPEAARLRVADNGVGFTDFPPNLVCGLASGLADLLEADLAYDRLAGWTIAEIAFPVRAD